MFTRECPKCRGSMEEGFIADASNGGLAPSKWIAGQPEKSFWHGIKIKDKKQVQISTYRCASCGYLESYAK